MLALGRPVVSSVSEVRQSPRYEVDIPAAVTVGQSVYVGRLRNLSRGGAMVWVPMVDCLGVGSEVEVSFNLPELDAPVSARAEVRWVTDADPQTLGVQFVTGFRARQTWALGRLFERLRAAQP